MQTNSIRGTRLWQFFLKVVKRYRPIYLLLSWVWRKGNAFSYIAWIYLKGLHSRPLESLSMHVNANRKILVAPSEIVTTPPPIIFPINRQIFLVPPHAQYEFPPIYVGTLINARVTGGTNLVTTENAIICHDLYNPLNDYTSEEMHRRTFVRPARNRIIWLMNTDIQMQIPQAACFTDACAENYAHWMTEVLPRINLFCINEKFAEVPIIVNAGLHPNLMESLKIVAGDMRQIISIAIGTNIFVEKLSVMSVVGYVPFEPRPKRLKIRSHGMFSRYGLVALRERLCQDTPKASDASKSRIMVKRSSGIRNITNARQIEELLISKGFLVVEPERLTFAEQVGLFSNADVVVGATGAALANLIFCKPSTKVIIMISDHEGILYWYWQNMACAVGNRVTYVLGKCVDSFTHPHSSYKISPSDLLDAIA